MRYIIYSFCYETPHLETELEIAKNLINEGHEVYFLICKGDLKTCFINPKHDTAICNVCHSKILNGLNNLNIPSNRILRFKKDRTIPQVDFTSALTSLKDLKSFRYKESDIGLAVASSIVSSTRDHNFDISQNYDLIIKGLKTAVMVHENFSTIIEQIKPDGVYVFNGRFLEVRPVLRLCEKNKIDFFTHERGGNLNTYMLRKNSTPHTLSIIKDEITSFWLNSNHPNKIDLGKKFFKDRRNKIVQTWHVFTDNQIIGSLPKGFDKSKRNITIFNSSMDEYEGIPDFNNSLYLNDNEGIYKICESFLKNDQFHFYLRIHPNLKSLNNTQTQKISEIGEKFNNLTLIPPEEEVDSYNLMQESEAIISFGSTIGIEAIFWNKSSILLGRAFYEDLSGLLKPNSHIEACEMILEDDKHIENNLDAIKYGFWCNNHGIEFKHYKSENLFSGKFNNIRIKANLIPRVILKLKKSILS